MVDALKSLSPLRLIVAGVILGTISLLATEAFRALAHDLRTADLVADLGRVGPWRVAAAALLTMTGYFALTVNESLILKAVGRPLPYRVAGLAAFTGYAISNMLGIALLTGGSARMASYRGHGLTPIDVSKVVILSSVLFWGSLILLCGAAIIGTDQGLPMPPPFDLPLRPIGILLVGAVLICAGEALRRRRLRVGPLTLNCPRPAMLAKMSALAMIDVAAASLALFVLIPGTVPGDFPELAAAYGAALVVGVALHVPGGVGVFEASFLALSDKPPSPVIAGLILFRIIYYLTPLAIALLVQASRFGIASAGSSRVRIILAVPRMLAPRLAAIGTAATGITLLVSASTPSIAGRMATLRSLLPDPLIEGSHLLSSVIGMLLLLLSPALLGRRRSALIIATALLIVGAILSISKGFDYEEAIVMLVAAAFLQTGAPAFYRGGGLGSVGLGTLGWAFLSGLFALLALIFVSSHGVFGDQPFWSHEWGSQAPRSFRALIAAGIVAAIIANRQLLFAPRAAPPDPLPEPAVFDAALVGAVRTDAYLALTGDKQFLYAEEGDALIMYRIHRGSWIVMGDPVGPLGRWRDLVWRVRELADRDGGRLLFYEISDRMLPLMVDLGFTVRKFGEEAVVPLDRPGDAPLLPKSVRAKMRRLEDAGLRWDRITASNVAAMIDTLQGISNDWLAGKAGSEKCFSLGRFDPAYLTRFDLVLVSDRKRPIAFANLWMLPNKSEMSIDLMRQRHDCPNGTMDFLIGRTIDHAAQQGFVSFNLGMTPLAGLESRPLAPGWNRLGAALFKHGGRFYSFAGLRGYKQKFHPEWSARYCAWQSGFQGWQAMIDASRLIGG